MTAKGDLFVNLCECYVFGFLFQCDLMQYYEWCAPVYNPVYVSSSIIYGLTAEIKPVK